MTEKDSSSDLLNIPAEYATRIYANADGGVTIEQADQCSDDLMMIFLSKAQAEQVYLTLQAFVEADR